MAHACSVCIHPDRSAIEGVHIAGASLRVIAKQFPPLSIWALRRHFQHIPGIIAQVVQHQEQENRKSATLPERVEQLICDVQEIIVAAKKKKNYNAALGGIRAALSCLEMLGRISGELNGGQHGEIIPTVAGASATVNVNLAPESIPEQPQDAAALVQRLSEIYNLKPSPPKIPETIM